jgi:hypothetical protein
LHYFVVSDFAVLLEQIKLVGLTANRLDGKTRAIISDIDNHLSAFAVQAYGDPAYRGFAGSLTFCRFFNSVHDCVSQHVLERRQHLVEDLTIQFARRSLDNEFGALTRFIRNLPYQSGQPADVTLERHHARSHQAIL